VSGPPVSLPAVKKPALVASGVTTISSTANNLVINVPSLDQQDDAGPPPMRRLP
jgi:hypothetical protein